MPNIIYLLLLGFTFVNGITANAEYMEESENRYVGLLDSGDLIKTVSVNYGDLFGNNVGNNSDLKIDFDAGNPDVTARIERPCEVYDSFCIRRFFAEHSKCRISAEQVPEPLFRDQATISTPSQNLTATLHNMEYWGLRTGKIEEFYINKESNNLILMLGFDYITFFGYVHLKFYRRGREPTITQDYGGIRFERSSITVVIPNLDDLRLDKADISSFLHVPAYSYVVFPGLVPTDPELLPTFVSFAVSLQLNEQEQFLTEGPYYASTFIQYNICDFGLKVL